MTSACFKTRIVSSPLIDLADPLFGVFSLVRANAINDAGQIVGEGVINFREHAFFATPVPLPAAIWLFGSALRARALGDAALLKVSWFAGQKAAIRRFSCPDT